MGVFEIFSLVSTAISALVGVTSSVIGAEAQAAAQKQQAEVQANSLRQQAEQEAQDQVQRSLAARRDNIRRLASAESQYAASGVTMAGTPTLSLSNMAEEQEWEIAMQESASRSKRNVLLTDAKNVLSAGSGATALTRTAGYFDGAGSFLRGAAAFGRDYNSFKKMG